LERVTYQEVRMKKRFLLSVSTIMLLVSVNAYSQGHGKPPFVTACAGKSAGDACSFQDREGNTKSDSCVNSTNPRGEAELTCGTPPQGGPGRGGRGQGPSQESNE